MNLRLTLLRGASALALAVAILGTSLVVPTATTAAAAPAQRVNGNDNESDSDGSDLANVPIIGDVVGSFEGQEPEEIAVGAIQLTSAAAETVVPMVIQLFK
jgi:hypothetical protein